MTRMLITGASRGIGLALTQAALEGGWDVVALARDVTSPELSGLAAGSVGARLSLLACDVTDARSVHAARAACLVEALDVIVNNAGVSCGPQRAPGFDFEITNRLLATNTVGPLRIYDAFVDLLRLGDSPRLLNISSEAGSLGRFRKSGKPDYAMSKAALNAFTLWAAAEEKGMIVVSIDPGWTQTETGGSGASYTPEQTAGRLLKCVESLTPAASGGFFTAELSPIPF